MNSVFGTNPQFAAAGSSRAAVPILLKSDGRESATMPASKKQQSDKLRFGVVGLQFDLPKSRSCILETHEAAIVLGGPARALSHAYLC